MTRRTILIGAVTVAILEYQDADTGKQVMLATCGRFEDRYERVAGGWGHAARRPWTKRLRPSMEVDTAALAALDALEDMTR
jgi:hypothetical protein